MKVLVLGGCGQQGSVVAADLANKYEVTRADISEVADKQCDLSDYKTLRNLMPKFDITVGALPSALGLTAIMAAIDSGVDYVDMSFIPHDVSTFNSGAMHKRIRVLHDCGVAPGLSHLLAGRAIVAGADDIEIYVGGVADSVETDYILTWSVADLVEEYTRPARIIVNGKQETLDALSDCVEISTSIGTMEAFYTDGLRSLLQKQHKVKRLVEKTLRWPGHIDEIKPLLGDKDIASKLKNKYPNKGKDVLILKVVARWSEDNITRVAELIVEGDSSMSAMARATALSCSAFTQLLVENKYSMTGVIPPEDVARNDTAYKFILDKMSEHGMNFNNQYPFMEE